jgi:predicted HicB family RNase H-like nuclease
MTQILRSAPPKKRRDGKPFRTFRLDPADDAKLKELAQRHGLSLSEVLRQAIEYVYAQELGDQPPRPVT